jgi:hypothetical protein
MFDQYKNRNKKISCKCTFKVFWSILLSKSAGQIGPTPQGRGLEKKMCSKLHNFIKHSLRVGA